MKRKSIAALVAVFIFITPLAPAATALLAPPQAFAQDEAPEPELGAITETDEAQAEEFPLEESLMWFVGLIIVWAVYAGGVPTVLQAAKSQFLDRLLIVVWTALRIIVGWFADEESPRFEQIFTTVRGWIIVLVVAGGAFAVAQSQFEALLENAPANIAAIDDLYLKAGLTVFLTAGAFLFHKGLIKDLFPVEAFSSRMRRVTITRAVRDGETALAPIMATQEELATRFEVSRG